LNKSVSVSKIHNYRDFDKTNDSEEDTANQSANLATDINKFNHKNDGTFNDHSIYRFKNKEHNNYVNECDESKTSTINPTAFNFHNNINRFKYCAEGIVKDEKNLKSITEHQMKKIKSEK